jgi:hypothetical protein
MAIDVPMWVGLGAIQIVGALLVFGGRENWRASVFCRQRPQYSRY